MSVQSERDAILQSVYLVSQNPQRLHSRGLLQEKDFPHRIDAGRLLFLHAKWEELWLAEAYGKYIIWALLHCKELCIHPYRWRQNEIPGILGESLSLSHLKYDISYLEDSIPPPIDKHYFCRKLRAWTASWRAFPRLWWDCWTTKNRRE